MDRVQRWPSASLRAMGTPLPETRGCSSLLYGSLTRAVSAAHDPSVSKKEPPRSTRRASPHLDYHAITGIVGILEVRFQIFSPNSASIPKHCRSNPKRRKGSPHQESSPPRWWRQRLYRHSWPDRGQVHRPRVDATICSPSRLLPLRLCG